MFVSEKEFDHLSCGQGDLWPPKCHLCNREIPNASDGSFHVDRFFTLKFAFHKDCIWPMMNSLMDDLLHLNGEHPDQIKGTQAYRHKLSSEKASKEPQKKESPDGWIRY